MELFALVSKEENIKTGIFQICRYIDDGKRIEVIVAGKKMTRTASKSVEAIMMPKDEVIRRGLEYGRDYTSKFDVTEAEHFSDKPFDSHEYFVTHFGDVK